MSAALLLFFLLRRIHMLSKQNIHKLFLLFSALLVGYTVFTGLFDSGALRLTPLRTFTYLSNIVMVVGFLAMLILYNSKGSLRNYISVLVIIAMAVTGLVYNFVLVPFASATMVYIGFVNFVTHAFSTILVLINYFVFETKGNFKFKHVGVAMLFPAMYWGIFVSIGGIIDFYPYFFMNPTRIGWAMVFVWFAILLGVFAGLGALLILFDRKRSKFV